MSLDHLPRLRKDSRSSFLHKQTGFRFSKQGRCSEKRRRVVMFVLDESFIVNYVLMTLLSFSIYILLIKFIIKHYYY